MRKVIVREYVKIGDLALYSKKDDGKGLATFHAWGLSYEEFGNGATGFSTAIVERENGAVENIAVELIKFVNT